MSFLSFIYFHHFFFYLFLSSLGYKQTIIDGGKVLIVQYVLSEIYNTCNFALHLALECNFRLTAYLWKKIEKGWTLVMSPPPSSGNVACLSCGHQGKSFGVLPWGSAFYSGEGWGRGLSRKCNYYSGYVQQGNFTTIVEETGAMYISALLYISLPSSILAAPLWPPRRAPSPISAYQDWHTQQWQNIQCSAGERSSSKLGHQSQRRGEPREHNQYLLLLDVDVIFLDLSVLNVLVLEFTLKHRGAKR